MTGIDRRNFLAGSVSALALSLTGCDGYTDGMTLDEILAMLSDYLKDYKDDQDSDEEVSGSVKLTIKYPAGKSTKVFTSGWVFGARCFDGDKDISDTVQWSGTGTFQPAVGALSRPVFDSEGHNTIILSVKVGEKTIRKTVSVDAVSPSKYCGVGAISTVPADAHGCPACPHDCKGPIITGSPNVFVNGKPAARVGDRGIHAACCGPNTFEISSGDPAVLINGRAAAWIHSEVRHCGGTGGMVQSG